LTKIRCLSENKSGHPEDHVTGSVLDFFRKKGGNPFVMMIMGIAWLVGQVVPGRLGRVAANLVFASLFGYLLILMNSGWLSRLCANLIPPAH
jgi:hypothetical protein